MKVLGIRFCTVSNGAQDLAEFFEKGLGMKPQEMSGAEGHEGFPGAVFPASDGSWIEMWAEGPGMPAGVMLQIIVDDADAWAEQARKNGLNPQGPMDEHGERIYFYKAPADFPISVQSKLA